MTALTLKAAKSKDLMPVFRSMISDAIEDYSDFIDIIRNQLRHALREMVRGRNHFVDQGEDQITFHILSQFSAHGFTCNHDKQVGGHVDLTIEYEDYMWFGEAKIHTSYPYLQKGWAQLTTRYMTGVENEDQGAFLIYNFNKNAANVTAEWREVLSTFHPEVVLGDTEDGLNFVSESPHEGTGRKLTIDHYNIPLYFKPKDT